MYAFVDRVDLEKWSWHESASDIPASIARLKAILGLLYDGSCTM